MKERPKFILRNLDETAIGYLGYILEPKAKFSYMDISELDFQYPAFDNGEKLEEYDLLTGLRVVEIEGYGQFILQKPVENNDTVSKIKTCKAYSLEYELTGKTITLEEGTYNFWNPLAPESSILGIILSEVPSWGIGTVSDDLIGKYRTFQVDNQSIYDFMKSKLQESYHCIFDFDTKQRLIHVRSLTKDIPVKGVYLSSKNLLNHVEIEENIEELVTALEVYGADELNIRSVNPMGINKIYNLDAYMNESYFSKEIITRWEKWKQTFVSYQQLYFDMSVEQSLLIGRLVMENAVLTELEGELSSLESKKAALVQGVEMDDSLQEELDAVNLEISDKREEIDEQKNSVIVSIENEIESLTNKLKNINQETAFSAFFQDEQIKILDRYFKCGSLTDSTFVATSTDSYSNDGTTVRDLTTLVHLINLQSIRETKYTADKTFYSIRGGEIKVSHSDFSINAEIVSGTIEVNTDSSFVFSLYLNQGTMNEDTEFPGATLSVTGTLDGGIVTSDDTLQFQMTNACVYLTRDVTEYQKQSIAMELYEYAETYLEKASQPTYYFSVDSGNFLALDEFVSFAKQFTLGERLYLHLDDRIFQPIVLSVSINFDDYSDFSIEFNEYFQGKEGIMDVQQLLEQAVSSGNSLDLNQYNYSNFVNSGAKTSVQQFMKSAIDAMKNNILAGDNNELKIDGTGLRCMKWDENVEDYSPKQIWIAHNAIMFTEDNWESASIGIGEFTDKNFGTLYGIVLPALVGTLLAGQNLIIESEKQDGGVAVFKMDAEGASLHNASFNLYGDTGGRIDMSASLGFVGGDTPDKMFTYDQFNNPIGVKTANGKTITKINDLDAGDTPNANFWLDMDGNAYFRGMMLATAGSVGGWMLADDYLYSGSGTTFVALNASGENHAAYAIWAGSENPSGAPFYVKRDGSIYAKDGVFSGTVYGASYKDSSGNAMTNGDEQFLADYLSLYGLEITNGGKTTFRVTANGAITVNGTITMSAGSSINWANVNETNVDQSAAYERADDAYWQANEAWENRATDENIFNILTSGGSKFGIFSDSTSNRLYINANYIKAGTIDADIVTLGTNDGGFCVARGNDGEGTTYGAMVFGSDGPGGDTYMIVTDGGCRMTAGGSEFYVVGNYIYASEEITSGSDRRIKNSIVYDLDPYEKFFLALKPTQFKYNAGTSNRFHTGFIAQDVETALLESGLTTLDFAGLVITPVLEVGEDGITDQHYRLRYGEFIALNTYMIQKLYRRVEELEKKLENHG